MNMKDVLKQMLYRLAVICETLSTSGVSRGKQKRGRPGVHPGDAGRQPGPALHAQTGLYLLTPTTIFSLYGVLIDPLKQEYIFHSDRYSIGKILRKQVSTY